MQRLNKNTLAFFMVCSLLPTVVIYNLLIFGLIQENLYLSVIIKIGIIFGVFLTISLLKKFDETYLLQQLSSTPFFFLAGLTIIIAIINTQVYSFIYPYIIFLVIIFGYFYLRTKHNKGSTEHLSIGDIEDRHFLLRPSVYLPLLLLVFIVVKLYFIFSNHINVSDDWQAIISAKNLLSSNSLTNITSADFPTGYTRGLYVTYAVAFFFKFFGESLIVAKFVPAVIGLINFVLFFWIAKIILKRNFTVVLSCLIYLSSPLVIFNHWFIRMYVFYEFFLLIAILLAIKLTVAIRNKKTTAFLYLFLILFTNFLCWSFSFDQGKYLIILSSGYSVLIALYLNRNLLTPKLYSKCLVIFNKRYLLFLLGIIVLAVSIYCVTYPENLLTVFLFSNLPNSEHISGGELLFKNNLLISIFFFLSIPIIWSSRNQSIMVIGVTALLLFLVHLFSSQDLQMTRALLYFYPVLVLTSALSLDVILQTNNKRIIFIIILLFIASIGTTYPKHFLAHPYLQGELRYQDDFGLYSFIKTNLNNYTVIQSNYETMPDIFFEINTKFNVIVDTPTLLKTGYFYYDTNSNYYRQISTNIPVIINKSDFLQNFLELTKGKTAMILLPNIQKYYLDDEIIKVIKLKLTQKKDFLGYELYYN